jgi:broad specificity phosphatase PhoE
MPVPTIYYIRHGETDWNAELRFQGRRDIALNEKGRRQAAENGRKLKALLGDFGRCRFLTSPLWRARETMEIVLGELGTGLHCYAIEDWLVEASYGELEGITLAEYKARDPQGHASRKARRWTHCPPGGESHAMVARRIAGRLETLPDPTVIVGHGVVGRVIRQRLLTLEPDEAANYTFRQDCVFIWRDGQENRV